jgi:hypothetical protein
MREYLVALRTLIRLYTVPIAMGFYGVYRHLKFCGNGGVGYPFAAHFIDSLFLD